MRLRFLLPILLLAACGGDRSADDPVSVRGWVTDVKGAKTAETYEQELARRTELFANAAVWVENTESASGGIAGNGAFIVLDVPPNKAILGFNAPGAESARIVLENIPGGADVFVPNVILENGGAKVLDPKAIQVRIAASIDQPRATGKIAKVAGYDVPVFEAPFTQLADRREYPDPGGFRPLATVK